MHADDAQHRRGPAHQSTASFWGSNQDGDRRVWPSGAGGARGGEASRGTCREPSRGGSTASSPSTADGIVILVDTSVWVAHFKGSAEAARLPDLLLAEQVLSHPGVIGELVLGGLNLEVREQIDALARASSATDQAVLTMVDEHELAGRGIGWVDAHLLASALLSRAALWTRDQALAEVARDLEVGVE